MPSDPKEMDDEIVSSDEDEDEDDEARPLFSISHAPTLSPVFWRSVTLHEHLLSDVGGHR